MTKICKCDSLYSERVRGFVLGRARTGSREICSVFSEKADEDFILYVHSANRKHVCDLLDEDDWISGGSGEEEDKFHSYKKKIDGITINLIITSNKLYFDSFVHATKIAKDLDLLDKNDRVELFRIFRDAYERKFN